MIYREFLPNAFLQKYIQCFFTCESENTVLNADSLFATGCIEIMFNVGLEGPEQIIADKLIKEPGVQLWGQTIRPFAFTSLRKHSMLGIRFLPHAAGCFFGEEVGLFNDQMIDLHDVIGKTTGLLHARLIDAPDLKQRISLLEKFLLARLSLFKHKRGKFELVESIVQDLNKDDFFENINTIAARYRVSSRHIQKIFVNYSGLSPNLFSKISRFQKSLQLLLKEDMSLTMIAYNCCYYDQSHFIKDFKTFTGFAPSHFHPEVSTDLYIPMNK